VEVGRPETAELGVEVGKKATLQQWVFAEIDARHDVAGAESDLLCFREEIVRVPVEHILPTI